MRKRSISVVIPAYNEELVLKASLMSLKKIFQPRDIFVVSDGSTDQTVKIAKDQGVNVMALRQNCGKAAAIKKLLKSRGLLDSYRYVLFSDADSRLTKSFRKEIRKHLKTNPALIVGTVASDRRGLISAFRTYEYGLSHRIYKTAQNAVKTITVAPSCASLYRSDVLARLDLSGVTLTEDFDLTIQIHQKKLGKIIYVAAARVITQDPLTFTDYWKQVLRWNTGTWQNIFLHKLYKPNTKLNLELYFLLLDNVFLTATLIFALLYPMIFTQFLGGMFASLLIMAVFIAYMERAFWIIPFCPLFPIFYAINVVSYYYSFPRAVFTLKRTLAWNKVRRYEVDRTAYR